MGKITFILGGARSGKSTYAVMLAKKYKNVAFIATCQPLDAEMALRIKCHRESRPKGWNTFEETKNPGALLSKISDSFDCIVVDCLTLLVSNLVLSGHTELRVLAKIKSMLSIINKKKVSVILISNEVGLGIVPQNKLGRDFRDIAGKANQLVAQKADDVFFIVAGIAMHIKGDDAIGSYKKDRK